MNNVSWNDFFSSRSQHFNFVFSSLVPYKLKLRNLHITLPNSFVRHASCMLANVVNLFCLYAIFIFFGFDWIFLNLCTAFLFFRCKYISEFCSIFRSFFSSEYLFLDCSVLLVSLLLLPLFCRCIFCPDFVGNNFAKRLVIFLLQNSYLRVTLIHEEVSFRVLSFSDGCQR